MNLRNPIVVFVARASTADGPTLVKREWLIRSLEPVKEHHEVMFPDQFDGCPVETFVFILQSNSPFRPAGEVMRYFTDLFKRAQQQGRDILLVVSGWDGLTSNQGAFQKLFALRPENVSVHLRILSVDVDNWKERIPYPRFYDVDHLQVCAVWAGDLDPEDSDVKIDWSTKLYLEMVPAIAAAKYALSRDFELLRELTYERNTHRWAKEAGHVCDVKGCNAVFYTAAALRTHRSRKHHVPRTEDSKFCQYCGKTYARKEGRVRHEMSCSGNPDRVTPAASLTSKHRLVADPTQVPILNDGVKPYDALVADDAPKLPRIDVHSPTIYRNERFCRYPECAHTERYIKMSLLRNHYKTRHNVVVPKLSTKVSRVVEAEHERGLHWLSACVFRDKVEGDPPAVSSF